MHAFKTTKRDIVQNRVEDIMGPEIITLSLLKNVTIGLGGAGDWGSGQGQFGQCHFLRCL